jgi:hypothetical protein
MADRSKQTPASSICSQDEVDRIIAKETEGEK